MMETTCTHSYSDILLKDASKDILILPLRTKQKHFKNLLMTFLPMGRHPRKLKNLKLMSGKFDQI